MSLPARVLDTSVLDRRRGLRVDLRAWYPDGAGPFPAVVFSHGFGYSRLGYGFLGAHLAARGILTVLPTHAGTDAASIIGFANPNQALRTLLEKHELWRSRAADIKAVIDALEGGERDEIGALAGKCDPARLGVAGHSFGAFTTLLIAGASVTIGGQEEQHRDPRPLAFAALSPPGLGHRGLHAGSLWSIERPLLSMFGSFDTGPHGQPADWRGQVFDDLPPGNKVELVVEGAPHETFANLPLDDAPPDPAHVETVERAVAAFFRAHLSGDAAALDELRSLPARYRAK